MRCIFCNISRLHRVSCRRLRRVPCRVSLSVPRAGRKTVRRCSATVRKLRKSGSGRARRPTESISEYSGHPPVGAFWNTRDPLLSGRSGCSEALRTGRSGAARPVGSFADGSDADRAASGSGYLISRSGCSRRKCSQLCDPLREAAFLPPPSPLTRSGPRAAWSGLEVV